MNNQIAAVVMVLTLGSLTLFAEESKKSEKSETKMPMEMTKEQREKAAESHAKMAECLKSDKPMSECRREMMDSDACPMMGEGMMKGKAKKKK